jgi:PAS domain S-box
VVRDDAGAPVALVGVSRNIADRRLAEEHLKQSEEQFRLIAENVADMIAVLDLDGRRIYNSPSYKSILGDPESLKGTDSYREIHPEDREKSCKCFGKPQGPASDNGLNTGLWARMAPFATLSRRGA